MLRISRSTLVREIQVSRFNSNKPWIELVAVQNVRAKKSFAFEPNMRFVLSSLRKLLTCTESKAYSIYDQFPSVRSIDMMNIVGKNIEILMKNGVSTETIIDNPFLIVMTEDALQAKLNTLLSRNMGKKMINDFVPLLELKEDRLNQVCELIFQEQDRMPGGNRIYYFSQKLKMEPNIVAKYCAKNEYLLVAPFEIVDRKVQILLDYNVKPISILRSLYALDRSEQVYVSRLQRLISLNTEDVKVWFFKCADDVFEKYLSKMHQTKLKRTKEKIEPQSMTKIQIENKLNEMLECDGSEAAHIYYNQISRFDQIDSAKQNIEFLRSNGVSLETITGNSAVLTMPIEQLQQKFHILSEMDPRHIDDILPMICVEKAKLEQFKQILDEQQLQESIENPIYHFSDKLKVPPSVVSACFANSPSIFFRSPRTLHQKLDILLAFGVELESILNAPITFRMNLNNLEKRLKELKSNSVEPIYSWMLTCSTSQLDAMIKRQGEQKEVLDGCDNAVDYIAKRLNWDQKAKENALKSCPSIAKCNVAKVRRLLDYLLTETHFTEADISSHPRVFMNSLETLKARFAETLSVEYMPKRLYIICLDRKRYLEIIEKHCQRMNNENIWCKFRKIEKGIKEK